MSAIQLTPEAIKAIQSFLHAKGVKTPIRIDLQSTGCCDPSLGLCMDQRSDKDVVHQAEGLTLVIDPRTLQAAGEVKIDYRDGSDKKGFVLTSSKPLSEWEGFGVTEIRFK